MANKVVCKVCYHQVDGYCLFKKCNVKLNKQRICDMFEQDMNKVKVKVKIPTQKRPDWYWDREQKRKYFKNLLKEIKKQEQAVEYDDQIEMVNAPKDTKHPLTGDLSRFITTAGKEKE